MGGFDSWVRTTSDTWSTEAPGEGLINAVGLDRFDQFAITGALSR